MNSKKILAFALVAGSVVLAGCNKKLNQFSADYFSVNPNPLEVVGERVPATVTAHIPQKFFVKNAEVTVTPYLVFDGKEVASQAYRYQGEKVRGNNPVINYDNGGTVSIPVMFNYQPEMIQSQLQLAFDVTQGNKKYVLPRVTVADGVVATAAIASASSVTPAIAPDKFQRIINEKYSADIKFLINQANIRDTELRSEAMKALNQNMIDANKDANREITEINIQSYASPDGSLEFNTALAQKRENNTTDYMVKQLKNEKIANYGDMTADFTAEDWEGFRELVAASDLQDKDLILTMLSQFNDPEERERQIRNLASIFKELQETILPQLRYSRITASINVIGKSNEEIQQLYTTNPSALTVDEILYCATLTNDPEGKMNIYRKTTDLYPNDYRAYNDLGVVQYELGKYDAAKTSFATAARLAPSAAEPQMNLGLLAMQDNDYRTANQRLGNAAGIPELADALGTYYLLTGDYNAAVRSFGDTASNNAALSQILTKDYSKAKTTLSSITNPDATSYYLMAILGARTNNESMVANNLRQAVKLDKSLADRARKDLEFANFNLSSIIY